MNFSRFFVDRPIFASVLSIIIFTVGLISIPVLPVSEYPEVVPPSVAVTARYPGANPKTIAETVATPLEEAINGVENMIYMKSVAGSDGTLSLTVTFKLGTDPDLAQVQVQNRVSQALQRLPEEVRLQGVTTQKQSPNLMMAVHLLSPDDRFDATYIRNYAVLHIRDELARIPGVGQAGLFGSGDYAMRLWVDPQKAAALGVTASDIVDAVREQNIQVSAGQIGAQPMPVDNDFLISINARGRLANSDEFGDIVLKTGDNGELIRLRELARIELASSEDALRTLLDGRQAVALPIFQAPGSNSLEVSQAVREKMAELDDDFPEGMTWEIAYDPTVFVSTSIKAVIKTLMEAVLLVVLVVILFLQTWRASIIPLLAVPVSIVGTFAVLLLLGFSINTLTLFGMVLAIGIVVDDAIVVVENVERNIEEGLPPLAAAHQAMREVSGPIVAISLVLCAVFVPMAFLDGITGQFYRQFAMAIAIATVISAVNSLTLSPALAATLLKPHGAAPDMPARIIDRLFGWLFRPFNRFFSKNAERYQGLVGRSLKRRGAVFAVYALLLAATAFMFNQVPGGFIPTQDKTYLVGSIRLPEGASLDRTEAVARRVSELALETEGIAHAAGFVGFNALQRTNTPNVGTVFVLFDDFNERDRSAEEIAAELNGKLAQIKEGFAVSFMPPPIFGLGAGSGYSLYIQDRSGAGYGALQTATNQLAGALSQTPGLSYPFSSYQANVPQLDAEVDRLQAKAQGVRLDDLFGTLQLYFGSLYINDFNLFGRTYRVMAQADAPFRDEIADIDHLYTRNNRGEMVPISTMVQLKQSYGPDPVIRYNGYPAADLLGQSNPAMLSSSETLQTVEQVAGQTLPAGMNIAWTDLSFEQVNRSNASMLVFPLALLLVFLVLAALYESWVLPLAVILIVPMCLLAALFGVWLSDGDNNVFVQVGLVVLMGLACKNAILIVEFARELEIEKGLDPVRAALEACRLRLRPIIMTSVAFIAGVVPLVLATGAGAEVRNAMGVTVFTGMIGVTLFGLLLTPVFYVALRKLTGSGRQTSVDMPQPVSATSGKL
ncbi:multidrug efflux RND transporter permease subunit [Microbulbifer thermotolerans]|uniref:Efflux pump membrane transporter n=1 Tax=Microbulbifer thermotolerans TaxID=252514 RepID=A0AB35HV81_MICTH|nr:multidrug efflux RND transporter permease subunit [Microbulbifer thermotolerans]MCX2780878.1 multidrug efflux RND transporter permease subunit [Microbulbifer thermotolerans]MCX2784268.1 multidrug efflux RND transporter permease subunit [Microbulbifer thermotolerans]MCX2800993.1 multidrug efflux RND transporter permease subunit [Microbulbifer thermotolerans]MCX2804843.1 multidrug efflux RND transporter permease subunit [Microbulbifer thermotolerans]MCX2841703.1 multidrug efflux RND transport